jgi:phospholipase/carboxylesterase
LVIWLHGIGSSEQEIHGLPGFVPEQAIFIGARGIHRHGNGYKWYTVQFTASGPVIDFAEAEASRAVIAGFIEEVIAAYAVDPTQVYLAGFSQGAIMSLNLLLTGTPHIAGIVAMSGRVLPEIKPLMANADQISKHGVLMTHGTQDTLRSITAARTDYAFLSQLGLRVAMHEYNAAHELTQPMITDANHWLQQQMAGSAS